MDVLILSGKFGMGHWSAAQALARRLEEAGERVRVSDLFAHAMPELAPVLYRGFSLLVAYGGGVYNLYHRLSDEGGEGSRPGWHLARALDALLAEEDPDLVVSTHPVCSGAVSRWKGKRGSALPLITCVTDVTCHGEWLHPGTDGYLVASDTVRAGLEDRGVDPAKILVTGIPVRGEFAPRRGGTSGRRELLIMGGGLGLMPRRESFYRALNGLPGVHTTILTGENRRLYRRLAGRYPNLEAVPFTARVYDYMGRADLMLSKPGGVTTFEAIASRLPMLAWEPFLDQERENARFLVEHGMARVVPRGEEACLAAIRGAIYDGEGLAAMAEAMDRMADRLSRTAVAAALRQMSAGGVCA